jgi:hypothetical protein
MAKIPLTPEEVNEVVSLRNREGSFNLPISADLELENADGTYAAVYGTTDPEIGASMVNISYLRNNIAIKPIESTDPPVRNELRLGAEARLYQENYGLYIEQTPTFSTDNPYFVHNAVIDLTLLEDDEVLHVDNFPDGIEIGGQVA